MKQLLLVFFLTLPWNLWAEEWGSRHLSYIREVGNQLYLSDFQIGSQESIKDTDGHGAALGFLIRNQGTSFFSLEFGNSHTVYKGVVEDGAEVSFSPQEGSGFEALSQSNNVFYDVDLTFSNPYVSFSYTNWEITRQGLFHGHFPYPSTYGVGLINQKVSGRILILGADQTQIAQARYLPGGRRFLEAGWEFNHEWLFISLIFRLVESPVLEVVSCNEAAIGQTACDRILAATGNRNNQVNPFTGGVLKVGLLF